MRRLLPALAASAPLWLTGTSHPRPADAPESESAAAAAAAIRAARATTGRPMPSIPPHSGAPASGPQAPGAN